MGEKQAYLLQGGKEEKREVRKKRKPGVILPSKKKRLIFGTVPTARSDVDKTPTVCGASTS